MDKFGDLLVFIRVAETKSLSETARGLGTTKSAVGKQIRRFEDALGAKLVNRTTRQFRLTEIGVAVYEQALPGNRQGATRGAAVAESRFKSRPPGRRAGVPMRPDSRDPSAVSTGQRQSRCCHGTQTPADGRAR